MSQSVNFSGTASVLPTFLLLVWGCANDLADIPTSAQGSSVDDLRQQALAAHEGAEAEADRTNPTREDLTAAWFPAPEWPEGTLPPVESGRAVPMLPEVPPTEVAGEGLQGQTFCRTGHVPEPEPSDRTPIVMEPPGVGRPEPEPLQGFDARYEGPLTDLNPDPAWAAAVMDEIDVRLAALEREHPDAHTWTDEERYIQKLALWAEYEAE